MRSHIRHKLDCSDARQEGPFDAFFKEMEKATKTAASAAELPRRDRRSVRLGKRPPSFPQFRTEDEDSQEQQKFHEEPTTAAKCFDASSSIAKMLPSDGATVNADKYVTGTK